jgi:hypothetical protein
MEELVTVAERRAVTRFESLGGYAIALGELSAPEFDGIYDNLLERQAEAKQTYKKSQLWHDLSAMEGYLWAISDRRAA